MINLQLQALWGEICIIYFAIISRAYKRDVLFYTVDVLPFRMFYYRRLHYANYDVRAGECMICRSKIVCHKNINN